MYCRVGRHGALVLLLPTLPRALHSKALFYTLGLLSGAAVPSIAHNRTCVQLVLFKRNIVLPQQC